MSDRRTRAAIRSNVLRFAPIGDEVIVHPDGRVMHQQGAAGVSITTIEDAMQLPAVSQAVTAAQERAADMLAAAQARAADMRAAAHEEAQALKAAAQDAGWQAGREDGYLAGVQAGRAEVAEALALVQRALAEADRVQQLMVQQAEPELIEMVIDALRSIIGELRDGEHDLVVRVLHSALARVGNQQVVRIRVHPDQVDVVRVALTGGLGTGAWDVSPDGAIGIGGSVIDTHAGEIDARLDVQLDEIARVLREAVPHVG